MTLQSVKDTQVIPFVYSFLNEAHVNNRLTHAYLVCGGNQEEDEKLTKWLAFLLFCEAKDSLGQACGKCRNCILVRSGGHPDCVVFKGWDESIKIAHTRQLKETVYLRPVSGKWKLVAILGSNNMTEEAAQSILKLLEEPPLFLIFLLTTPHQDTILPTIVSRSQLLYFNNKSEGVISAALAEKILSAMNSLKGKSGGGKGCAWQEAFEALNVEKEDRSQFLAILTKWCWDLARLKSGFKPSLIGTELSVSEKWREVTKSQAEDITIQQIFEAYQVIREANLAYNKNGNWRLLLDVLLLKLQNILSREGVI